MGQLFEAVVDYLTEDDWKYQIVKEDAALVLNFRGRSGSWQCFANVDEERGWFSFYSILPANVPDDKRDAIAEFLTRANYGLVIGNFEMDYTDGEVRYKTSVDVEGGELSAKMIENLMQANLTAMDRYFPGLMGVLYGDREPAEAIADAEGLLDDDLMDDEFDDDIENMPLYPDDLDDDDDDEDEDGDEEGRNGDPKET